MPKEAPVMTIIIDDHGTSARTISNDITDLDFATPRGVQEVTGVDKSAIERLLLLADFSATYNGVFNDASNLSHAVFSTIPSTSIARTCSHAASGQTLAVEAFLTDYIMRRTQAGEMTWSVPAVLQDGSAPTWS